MELTSISCGNCGAPLQVPPNARFVTCNHCQSHLAVKHSDSVTWTEKLDQLDQRTDRIEEELSELRYDSELQRLDREWERERESYMITDKDGRRHVPSTASAVVIGVVTVGFGLFWTINAMNSGAPGGFGLFGILFILAGFGLALYSFFKAKDYMAAKRRYQQRRSRLRRR